MKNMDNHKVKQLIEKAMKLPGLTAGVSVS